MGGGIFAYYSYVLGIEHRIRMVSSINGCAPINVRISGCALPVAKAPANAAEALAAPRTSSYVDWILSKDEVWDENQIIYTPDLTPIILEIMQIPGWARGCPMLFFFVNKSNTSILHEIEGYDTFIVQSDHTHAWLREVYWNDPYESLLVLE